MINAQDIANHLVQRLDAIGQTRPTAYEFSLFGEIAEGYEAGKINGMVKTESADITPVPAGYVEGKYVFVVQMFVGGVGNKRYLNVKSVVDELIETDQDSSVPFGKGKGVLTFTPGVPKNYKIEYAVGEGVPITFTVSVTYTENAVTSGDKHWFLDGKEIPYLSESVTVEKEGITKKVFSDAYNSTVLIGQTKFYNFTVPYESKFFSTIQKEILSSETAQGELHTLTYYDGVSFTEKQPFTAKVRVYRSAKSSSSRPNGSAFDITFTDVYDSGKHDYVYRLALIDFPFDMQGEDTRYFDSVVWQEQYFNDKVLKSSAPYVEIEAPNLDNLVITRQVYGKVGQGKLAWASQFDLVNKNYAIIRVDQKNSSNRRYFYYFITNCTIGADGLVTVDLKLDTVQTYFFDPNITFSDCLIERAHLDRFEKIKDENGKIDPDYVKFVTDPNSKIYNAEEGMNFPKRLVSREKLKLNFTGNKEVDDWLESDVAYWVYVFIDPSHPYAAVDLFTGDILKEKVEGKEVPIGLSTDDLRKGCVKYPFGMRGATNCICYPIYKRTRYIEFLVSNDITLNMRGENPIRLFEGNNNQKSFYYGIKVSIIPPFMSADYAYVGDEKPHLGSLVIPCQQDGHLLYFGKVYEGAEEKSYVYAAGGDYGLFWGSRQREKYIETSPIALKENEPIAKSDITSADSPKIEFNPKLNGQNFKELVITASSGDTFTYDIQKLNESEITFEYTEPIVPDVTKYYLRVKGSTGLYGEGTDKNYMGLVGSTDNGLAYANDAYAEYLANNKNFFMQSNMKIGAQFVGGMARGTAQLLSDNIVGGLGSIVGSVAQAGISVIDRAMTIDNMRSAPDQLKGANGSVIFNMFADELGLYVEKYSALEGDLKTANDFMNIYGFAFGAVGNVRDYANKRVYHNYVKAQLQSINGNISNTAREDLRQRFAKGVRFWNKDTVEYTHENYEKWLSE